jgi:hypothetical protein
VPGVGLKDGSATRGVTWKLAVIVPAPLIRAQVEAEEGLSNEIESNKPFDQLWKE